MKVYKITSILLIGIFLSLRLSITIFIFQGTTHHHAFTSTPATLDTWNCGPRIEIEKGLASRGCYCSCLGNCTSNLPLVRLQRIEGLRVKLPSFLKQLRVWILGCFPTDMWLLSSASGPTGWSSEQQEHRRGTVQPRPGYTSGQGSSCQAPILSRRLTDQPIPHSLGSDLLVSPHETLPEIPSGDFTEGYNFTEPDYSRARDIEVTINSDYLCLHRLVREGKAQRQ